MEPETNLEIITRYYEDILQLSGTELTAADRADIASYAATVDSGALTLADARAALIASPAGEQVQDIVRLYQVVFGRVPDEDGLDFQVDQTRAGFSIEGIATGFSNSAEFTARFGSNTVNAAFINAVYQQTLGRTPAASEVQFYLDSGFSAGRIALAFAESPEFVGNTQTAVEEFLDSAAQGTQDYTGSLGGGAGPINPGDTFTLTTDAGETITGTAGNDTINAILSTGASSTINDFDTVNGGAGVDTLNIISTGAAAGTVTLPATASVSNVEVINFLFSANPGASVSIDASQFEGATQIWQVGNAGDLAELASGQTAGYRNTAVAADDTITAADGATSVNVALDNVTTASVVTVLEATGGDVTSVTVNGTVGTDGDLTIDTSGTTATDTINVGLTTDGDLTVTADGAVLTTLNASASTGDLGIVLSGATYTALESLTTGSGNDTVTFATVAGTTAETISIDLGAGNDVLNFDAAAATADVAVSITLGAGNDTLAIDSLANISDDADITNDLVTVTDFSTAQDVLDLSGLAGDRVVLNNTQIANVSGATTLDAALDLVAAAVNAANGAATSAPADANVEDFAVFNYGGNAYLYVSNTNGGSDTFADGDGLVRFTGVDATTFSATSLIV